MTTTPAPMGEPQGEADRSEVLVEGSWFKVDALPEILGNYMRSVSEHHRQCKELSAKLHESADRVESLEGQLATARGQLAHFAAQHQPHDNMYRTCRTCKDGYGEPRPWPCEDALRLDLVGNCPECAGPTLRGVDRECPKCDAKLPAVALGLDGGDPQ